jgi:2-dehydropantoate 2-reductase
VRIAIIGTGAMGSVYAGLLADAGLDVCAVDLWAEHIAAINRVGLRVSGASGERVAKLRATTNAREAAPADLVIIATKASGVEAAAKDARGILARDGLVLTHPERARLGGTRCAHCRRGQNDDRRRRRLRRVYQSAGARAS